jgi:hypothetical protein
VPDHDSELRLFALETRINELEHRLRALGACVDELAAAIALSRNAQPTLALEPPLAAEARPAIANGDPVLAEAAFGGINTGQLPGGLRQVVELVQQGQLSQAQRDLYNLPEEMLQAHQDVVTMIATALFIQRGDFASAKKVLTSAVQATGDARLRKLLAVVEQYCPA